MADMTLVEGNQPMYVSADWLSDEILQTESEDLSQIPLPKFVGKKKDVRLDPMSQSSLPHPSPVLQQELWKLEQQQILWMKLQQRQMLSQRVQELQGQLLSQLYPTQTVGRDNGGYPMAYSSPYLQSPVQTSMGSWYETQTGNQTWSSTPKVPKVPRNTFAQNKVPPQVPHPVPGPESQGTAKDTNSNQKIVKLPKANLNKTDDKNKGVSTAGMIWIGFDGPRCKGPRSFPSKQPTGSK